jgi:hypothetical protein
MAVGVLGGVGAAGVGVGVAEAGGALLGEGEGDEVTAVGNWMGVADGAMALMNGVAGGGVRVGRGVGLMGAGVAGISTGWRVTSTTGGTSGAGRASAATNASTTT